MGETGSVSNFLFDYKGRITIARPDDIDTFEMVILNTEAEDYSMDETDISIISDRTHFLSVKNVLISAGYKILS